jgi:hypothetical protein
MSKRLFIWKIRKVRKRKREGEMSTLASAITRKQWDLVALCLLLGMVQTLSKLPADSIEGLIDILDGGNDARKG